MSKEIINNEEVEVMETEQEVVETKTKEKFGTKIVNFGKKHAKKAVAVGAAIGLGLLGYALGKKSSGEDEDCCDEYDDTEFDDSEFEEMNSETESYGE